MNKLWGVFILEISTACWASTTLDSSQVNQSRQQEQLLQAEYQNLQNQEQQLLLLLQQRPDLQQAITEAYNNIQQRKQQIEQAFAASQQQTGTLSESPSVSTGAQGQSTKTTSPTAEEKEKWFNTPAVMPPESKEDTKKTEPPVKK